MEHQHAQELEANRSLLFQEEHIFPLNIICDFIEQWTFGEIVFRFKKFLIRFLCKLNKGVLFLFFNKTSWRWDVNSTSSVPIEKKS